MGSAEILDADLDFFASLDVDGLVEQFRKADQTNDEDSLRLISAELGRRITQLSEIKASCDDSIHKLEMKDFG